MTWILYLIAGIIIEAFVIRDYAKDEVPYTKAQMVIGGILDIITWPIVILVNIILWNR